MKLSYCQVLHRLVPTSECSRSFVISSKAKSGKKHPHWRPHVFSELLSKCTTMLLLVHTRTHTHPRAHAHKLTCNKHNQHDPHEAQNSVIASEQQKAATNLVSCVPASTYGHSKLTNKQMLYSHRWGLPDSSWTEPCQNDTTSQWQQVLELPHMFIIIIGFIHTHWQCASAWMDFRFSQVTRLSFISWATQNKQRGIV